MQGAGNIAGMADSGFRTILFGTVSGGLSAELTGGNFWQGAATGLIVSGLNHAAHSFDNGYESDGKGGYKQINDNGGDIIDYMYNSENGMLMDFTFVENLRGPGPSGTTFNRSYGVNDMRFDATNQNLIDPTGDFVYGGYQFKFGLKLTQLGLRALINKSSLLKSSFGLATLGSASKSILPASIWVRNGLGKGDWIRNVTFGLRGTLPTFYGNAKTLSTFIGRNALAFGPANMLMGSYIISKRINF